MVKKIKKEDGKGMQNITSFFQPEHAPQGKLIIITIFILLVPKNKSQTTSSTRKPLLEINSKVQTI